MSSFRASPPGSREGAGFLAAVAFVCLASVRDVYLGGLFQRVSPLTVAVVAFTLCTLIFLPFGLARHRGAMRTLWRRPWQLFWVNATSALAWISFFYALRTLEPMLVQILFAGVGPLSVEWLGRLARGTAAAAPLTRAERPLHVGLAAALGAAALVALSGLSGSGPQSLGAAAVGVGLALVAGVSISVNTVLCRQLNDAGVDPAALVSVRFVGAAVIAGALAPLSGDDFSVLFAPTTLAVVVSASLLLVVFPIYVNQVGIALASPLTVRVVLAGAPALVFLLQLVEGRLASSPYSLGTALFYGVFAIACLLARRRAIRTVALA